MNLSSLQVHNFRSITDSTFHFGRYSLLVGANNCGKSTVIDAIRIFYEKDLKFEEKRDCPRCAVEDAESWIDAEFTLTPDEEQQIKEAYRRPQQKLKLRKILKTKAKGEDGKAKQGIYGYVGDAVAEEHFYGAKNIQHGKLAESIIYIPTVSKVDEHTKMSGPSALRDILSNIFESLVGQSESFKALTEQFNLFSTGIRSETTTDGRSLSGLEAEVNARLEEWQTRFRLDINCFSEADIIKSLVAYTLNDPALRGTIEAGQCGHGFQRHFIFTLLLLAAKYANPAPAKAKKDFTPKLTLLLFEEPEAFLHPSQQDALKRGLHDFAANEAHQVIVSSHSPHFVSRSADDIPAIIRLRRENGVTKAAQVREEKLQSMFEANARIAEILGEGKLSEEEAEAAESLNYFLWLDPSRCGMFFARRVLLVEGASEKAFVGYLLDSGTIEAPEGGIFVLDAMGKYNVHRFMNLLGELETDHSVLYDGDEEKGVHAALNALVEDSRNPWTLRTRKFEKDLEDFLGVEKAKEQSKKPKQLMLNLKRGAIAAPKLNAFCGEIRNLFVAGSTEVPAQAEPSARALDAVPLNETASLF